MTTPTEADRERARKLINTIRGIFTVSHEEVAQALADVRAEGREAGLREAVKITTAVPFSAVRAAILALINKEPGA